MSSNDRSAQDAVTNRIPSHNLGEIASLKTMSAITAVATISKLFRSDTFAAFVMVSPKRRHIGAAISRTTMAAVYGTSLRVRLVSLSVLPEVFLISEIAAIPRPAPT